MCLMCGRPLTASLLTQVSIRRGMQSNVAFTSAIRGEIELEVRLDTTIVVQIRIIDRPLYQGVYERRERSRDILDIF